jgi:DNA adenine methylase
MQIKRPALRYHGGKWKLAPWIISHFPAHRIYVEPYAGGVSVLMCKPRSYAEVYNDTWGIVVNVFRVLRDPEMSARLREQLILTPFARDEFLVCGDAEIVNITDPVEMARRTILRSFAGFGSAATNAHHSTGFRSNSNRSGTTPAHDWANYPDNIAAFTERLRGVVIENKNAVEVILQHDTPKTLFYVDPPYPHSTRKMARGNAAYECEMTDEQHRELAGVLHSVSGMVIISGYPCELYDKELYSDWTRIECRALADGASERTEVLWFSDNAVQKTLL